MTNHQEARVKLRNTKLSKLKSSATNGIETIFRLNKNNFGNE